MIEYQYLLDFYRDEGSYMDTPYYDRNKPKDINMAKATAFLEKYWLPETEYREKWKPIQDTIFCNLNLTLPEMIFRDGFQLIAVTSGFLFGKEDFEIFRQCLLSLGEENFVVIQQDLGGTIQRPLFYMKFPAAITWDEMMSGDFISMQLCGFFLEEFMVYGTSGEWAKYTVNDFHPPFDIYAFRPKHRALFQEKIKPGERDKIAIDRWLPATYKGKIIL